MFIDTKYYEDRTYDEYKNSSLQELEFAVQKIKESGSNGKGQLASVPIIRIGVLEKLIKERKRQNGL